MSMIEADTAEIPRPPVPALGRVDTYSRRTVVRRGAFIAAPLILALLVRTSGLLSPAPDLSPLPGLPDSVEVAHGLVRGGPAQELDLVGMHDNYGVRWLVDLEPADAEEEAVARQLGMKLLQLDISDGVPTVPQITTLLHFLAGTAAANGGVRGSTEVVYMHDRTGCGPVLVVSAALQLLREQPLSQVLSTFSPAELSCLSTTEMVVLQDVEAATQGGDAPSGRYAQLRGMTW